MFNSNSIRFTSFSIPIQIQFLMIDIPFKWPINRKNMKIILISYIMFYLDNSVNVEFLHFFLNPYVAAVCAATAKKKKNSFLGA